MYEAACEEAKTALGDCDQDQQSFKAYLARWMAATAKLCPWTSDTIMGYLRASAAAAALQCEYAYLLSLLVLVLNQMLTRRKWRHRRRNLRRAL
jgi:hypothetical protein